MDSSEGSEKRSRKMGNSPLSSGGALDWIGEDKLPTERESTEDESNSRDDEAASSGEMPDEGSPGGEGLRPGFRRHTLIMREDHIEKVDRLVTLEKLRSGGKLKKDVVAEIFEWYFEEHSDALSLDDVS